MILTRREAKEGDEQCTDPFSGHIAVQGKVAWMGSLDWIRKQDECRICATHNELTHGEVAKEIEIVMGEQRSDKVVAGRVQGAVNIGITVRSVACPRSQ